MSELVEKVAEAVLNDLMDRRGIKQELRAIEDSDEETWAEIKQAIGTAALAAIEQAGFGVRRREPTKEMIEAAFVYALGRKDVAEAVWVFMFDHKSAAPDRDGG